MRFPLNPIGYRNSSRCYWCNNNNGHLMGNPNEPCYCVTGIPEGAWIDHDGDLHLASKPVQKAKPTEVRTAVCTYNAFDIAISKQAKKPTEAVDPMALTVEEVLSLIDEDRRRGILV